MRTLVLYLPEDEAAPASWALYEGLAPVSVRVGEAQPTTPLVLESAPERVWVLTCGAAVTVHAIELPVDASERHALAGAAFALEDNLAVTPDALHFALGAAKAKKRLVGVADHGVMARWLARIAAYGLQADLLTPDFLAQPEGGVMCNGRVLMRTPEGGFTAEPDLAPWLMGSDVALPTLTTEDFLTRAYAALSEGPALTLLQGRYRPRRDWRGLARPWRRAGALAAGVAAIALLGLVVEGVRLNRQADAATVRAEAVFRAALPEVKRVVNPRAQMRAHLQGVNLAASGSFLALSEVIVAATAAVEGAEVSSLRFDGRRAEAAATLSLPTFDSVEALKAEMIKSGGVVQEGGARQDGARILADMIVRLP
jgi:general secretion pathway protein L